MALHNPSRDRKYTRGQLQWSERDPVAYETMGRLSEAVVCEASSRSIGVTGTGLLHTTLLPVCGLDTERFHISLCINGNPIRYWRREK
jgi:hypothetical protein